jgi:hypothetical protein
VNSSGRVLCPVVGCGISNVESLGSANTVFVSYVCNVVTNVERCVIFNLRLVLQFHLVHCVDMISHPPKYIGCCWKKHGVNTEVSTKS